LHTHAWNASFTYVLLLGHAEQHRRVRLVVGEEQLLGAVEPYLKLAVERFGALDVGGLPSLSP
jgi:hypothetical protein